MQGITIIYIYQHCARSMLSEPRKVHTPQEKGQEKK